MNEKDLCLSLTNAETEDEVIDILKKSGYWNDQEVWYNVGGVENNRSQIGNQQSKPEAAIVEKIINSVDHTLIRECLKKNINPESQDAPQSIWKAGEKFFDIEHGELSRLKLEHRKRLSDEISLIASGSKKTPSFTIIDKGEGQTPNAFPDTFLSLSKSNKQKIPFVQGKFGQGGTGVLQFCGKDHNIQLIVT